MAIRGYRDRATRDIAAGMNSKLARRALPIALHEIARRRLAFLAASQSLDDLRVRRGLNLHQLTRERRAEHAIRINDQYRICFVWTADNNADLVRVTDYH